METIELSVELEEVQKTFDKYRKRVRFSDDLSYHPFFRGLSKSSYKLYSKLSRPFTDQVPTPLPKEKFKEIEQQVIKQFNEKLKKYDKENILTSPKDGNDVSKNWYLVLQMQHLEMPTRMMDWTGKELIALFFAVCEEKNDGYDGIVWGFPISEKQFHLVNPEQNLNPFDETQSWLINLQGNMFLYDNYKEKLAEQRILKQGGRFYFQNEHDSLVAIEENDECKERLTKFVVPSKFKKKLREILDVELRKPLKHFLTAEQWEEVSKKTFMEILMERFDPTMEKIMKEINDQHFQDAIDKK